jgi:hypothetical protein
MSTLTEFVAKAANSSSDRDKRASAAGEVARILAELSSAEVDLLPDKLIDDIAGLLVDENDVVKYYAASGLGSMGQRAARAIPALEQAWTRAQPIAGSEMIGPSLGLTEVFRAAISRISVGRKRK